jgi:hypothetical protein
MLSLSDKWVPVLASQPETGMGYQICSIFLIGGRRFDHVVIAGGVITSVANNSEIPFREDGIDRIVVNDEK